MVVGLTICAMVFGACLGSEGTTVLPSDSAVADTSSDGASDDTTVTPDNGDGLSGDTTVNPDDGDGINHPDGLTCTAGSRKCLGDEVQVCDPDGTIWSSVVTCLQPGGCMDGACCEPQCSGKSCGDDGCGGTCGTCEPGAVCDAQSNCQSPCPAAEISVEEGDEVIPETDLHLGGADSTIDASPWATYSWTVQAPVGGSGQFVPSASAQNPTFKVEVAGTYVFELAVGGSDGVVPDCPTSTFTVVVVPGEAIHVELVWDTPGDPNQFDVGPEAGADMDLHLAHQFGTSDHENDYDGDGEPDPWFHELYDCYWNNVSPEWGDESFPGDNATLVRDDNNGAGPEMASLDVPEPGLTYYIGAHSWNSNGFGKSFATVRIYIFGALAAEFTSPGMLDSDFWSVARIQWPSGTITPFLAPGDDPLVTNGYPTMFFGGSP